MTKDEALKLALDFVASISPAFICEATHHKNNERHAGNEPCPHVAKQKATYEAIKEALAQPEPWEKFCDSNCVWTDHHPNCKLAEQEPVAYGMWDTMIGCGGRMMMVRLDKGQDGCTVPLYTTPPQRKPLTDEEIDKAWRSCDYTVPWEQHRIDIARAIEAAHGIKGEA